MRFRFIRYSDNPVDQADYESVIRACFEPCTQQVKDRLDKFFKDKQESVTFKFDGQTIEVRRDT